MFHHNHANACILSREIKHLVVTFRDLNWNTSVTQIQPKCVLFPMLVEFLGFSNKKTIRLVFRIFSISTRGFNGGAGQETKMALALSLAWCVSGFGASAKAPFPPNNLYRFTQKKTSANPSNDNVIKPFERASNISLFPKKLFPNSHSITQISCPATPVTTNPKGFHT